MGTKHKTDRLSKIRELVCQQCISNQDVLLGLLQKEGFHLTQATLSRDLKRLKISKTLTDDGSYRYSLPHGTSYGKSSGQVQKIGVNSLEFSGSVAVMKTHPGYAGGIAAEIDQQSPDSIVGTIAGDDTILIIPREGYSREEIAKLLTELIQNNGI